jgi:hypothetical protein
VNRIIVAILVLGFLSLTLSADGQSQPSQTWHWLETANVKWGDPPSALSAEFECKKRDLSKHAYELDKLLSAGSKLPIRSYAKFKHCEADLECKSLSHRDVNIEAASVKWKSATYKFTGGKLTDVQFFKHGMATDFPDCRDILLLL